MVILLLPQLSGPRWRSIRVTAFCATSASICIPFIHAIALRGFASAMKATGIPYYLAEGALLVFGVICFSVCLLPQPTS